MQDLQKLIKALKAAKELLEKDNNDPKWSDENILRIARQKMKERGFGDKQSADHLRDIDETIPAKQRSNIKSSLKAQETKVKKPKLEVIKAEELADTLIKSLQELTKDEMNQIKRTPVNGHEGWSQDPTTGALHNKIHGVVSTFKTPGGFNVRHNGNDLGSFPSIAEAGAKIREHMNHLGSMKIKVANPGMNKEDMVADDDGQVAKSNYGPKGAGLYNPADNIKRKMNNTGDVAGNGPNQNVKSYSSKPGQLSAKAQAALQQARDNNKNKQQPVKVYSKEEIAALEAQRLKKSTEWSENEMANKLSGIIPFGQMMPRQPTDAELEAAAGVQYVTAEQAEAMSKSFNNTINDFFAEACKPISSRFANEEEEAAYWNSLRVQDKPDNGPGY